jgi:hypothetical protein
MRGFLRSTPAVSGVLPLVFPLTLMAIDRGAVPESQDVFRYLIAGMVPATFILLGFRRETAPSPALRDAASVSSVTSAMLVSVGCGAIAAAGFLGVIAALAALGTAGLTAIGTFLLRRGGPAALFGGFVSACTALGIGLWAITISGSSRGYAAAHAGGWTFVALSVLTAAATLRGYVVRRSDSPAARDGERTLLSGESLP